MYRYHSGEFGDENLSVEDILAKSDVPNLLDDMDFYELKYLQSKSTSLQNKRLFGEYMTKFLNS